MTPLTSVVAHLKEAIIIAHVVGNVIILKQNKKGEVYELRIKKEMYNKAHYKLWSMSSDV